jgi:hypothetical protein
MVPPMKVTRNTPDQLIIADTPWLIGIMLVVFVLTFVAVGVFLISEGTWAGLLFIIAGGGLGFGAFAVFVRRVQLIFDRPLQTITQRNRSLFGYSEVRHELPNLSHAILETSTTSKGGLLYRPTLVLDAGMSAGHMPIVDIYTNTSGPKRIVDAINTWLGTNPS